MYLHHQLWLLPLFVTAGAKKHSHRQKSDEYNYYDGYEDDLENGYFNDRDYSLNNQMYDDTPPSPDRNKLLIIVLGGSVSHIQF